jgi:HPt (histidine-containing phosphotransfer) domain-containing protein
MPKQTKYCNDIMTDAKADNCPIDEKPLKTMFGDDPKIFEEILNEFIGPTWNIINEIKTGCEKRSAEEVEMGAHKLKSSARSVGAYKLGDICSILEIAGREKDWKTIDQCTPLLDSLMKKIVHYIKNL